MEKGTLHDDEKGQVDRVPASGEVKKASSSCRTRTSFLMQLIVSCIFLIWLSFNAIPRLLQSTKSYSGWPQSATQDGRLIGDVFFEDIVPNEKLQWHHCYQGFYCARLTVAMDYNRPLTASKDHPKVHIALVLKRGSKSGPAAFSTSPLLINPGGPGGSGTTFALLAASLLQTVIDPEQDIIGFDPRGIAATTPRADCFSYPIDGVSPGTDYQDEDYITGSFNRMMWQISGLNVGNVNSSSDAFRNLHARARTVANLCQDKDNLHGNDSILRYVHTPSVARDMISIIDAWDEWQDTLNITPAPCKKHSSTGQYLSHNPPAQDTKGKLLYWGFSYGTLLGATFASMFPDRVGRIVLDGVVDADHYVAPIWMESIQDADAVYESFSRYCFEAVEQCNLYRASDKSAKDIADRFDNIMMNLKDHPLTVINKVNNTPYVVTYSVLKMLMFSTLYAPNSNFPMTAIVADWLYRGEIENLGGLFAMPEMPTMCNTRESAYSFPNEAQLAIMCSDKRYPLNNTVPELELMFEQIANTSSFADVWMSIMINCQAWSIKAVDPPMRWDDHPAHAQRPINTSFPVLFISNTYDPVTPLSAGLKMAKKFNGAGLIEQQSEGHCSIAATSVCTIKALRAYFREGKTPPTPTNDEWEQCSADDWPWHPFGSAYTVAGGDTHIEMAIEATKQIQKVFNSMTPFGSGFPMLRNMDWEIWK